MAKKIDPNMLLTAEERSLLIKLAGRFETLAQFWRRPSGSSELLADEYQRDCATLCDLIERTAKQEPK
jgi:hypothetical protein